MNVCLTLDHWIDSDRRVFQSKKKLIRGALRGETGIVDGITEENKESVFYMLLFCLCVPQSKAIKAEVAITKLRKRDFYSAPMSLREITDTLEKLVRFHSTKAKRLHEARKVFLETELWQDLRDRYEAFIYADESYRDPILQAARKVLIRSIKGMAMKTSSHFLRNVGMNGLAILDVHVINGLQKRKIIDIDKLSGSTHEYLEIEEKMKDYAKQVGITLDELDLLLWSQKTGYVFK